MPRRANLPLVLAFGLLLTRCHGGTEASTEKVTGTGPVMQIDRGTVEREILVDGNLYSPSSKAIVVQRVRWYWNYTVAWTAEEGSLVKKGDPVVRLDPAAIQKDLDEKGVELEQEKLKLEETKIKGDDQIAEALADVAAKEFEVKKQQLLVVEDETVSLNERRRQKLTVQEAQAALSRAKDKVATVRLTTKKDYDVQNLKLSRSVDENDEIKRGLANMEMTAPDDGILIFPLFSGEAGWQKARAGAGVNANVTIAEVANPADLVARLFIPEVDADGIVQGIACRIALDIKPNEPINAVVTRISTMPSTPAERDGTKSQAAAQNIRQFEVLAKFESLPAMALPGLSVRARLSTFKRDGVVRVPVDLLHADAPVSVAAAAAVAPSPEKAAAPAPTPAQGAPQNATVLTRKAGGSWQKRQLKLGVVSLSHAEVLEGLAEGDEVQAYE